MKQGLLLWSPSPLSSLTYYYYYFFPTLRPKPRHLNLPTVSATLESTDTQEQIHLSARERRRLRNERRDSKAGYNWREEVEERLMKKPKKRHVSTAEELNLDNLSRLGPQWWIVRVSRAKGHETADLIANQLVKHFPDIGFKVYTPAVQVKSKLKNGTYSIKPKSLFPGCVFLNCVLNRELYNFIREIDGVGGFVGSKVGNTKRQINKPRPVDEDDMEAIFQQAKEEQEKTDQAFEEEEKASGELAAEKLESSFDLSEDLSTSASKPLKRSKRASSSNDNVSSSAREKEKLVPGTSVQVLSGTFAGFEGNLKKLNRKTKKATVGFTLFGKESLVDLDVNEIASVTK